MAGDRFGNAVSLSSKTVVVGAYRDDGVDVDNNLLTDAGSAYVFRHDGTTWIKKARLTAVDAAAADEFGYSVAIGGDTVLVGAYKDDGVDVDNNLVTDTGSTYVFTLLPENQPPVAVAGDTQEVVEGDLVTLDGSGSFDLDGDDLNYEWQQNPGPSIPLDDPSKVNPTFTAPSVSTESETFTFQLIVNDGKAESAPAKVKVTVLRRTQSVVEINSFLGLERRRWGLDRDIYRFQGSQGDNIIVTLKAKLAGRNNGGNRATLKLNDNISGVRFYRTDSSVLPNTISATLPATGQYHITVAGQPRFYRGKRFQGEYTLSLEGTSGRLEQGLGSPAVSNKPASSRILSDCRRIWNWLAHRFRR
jgi:hypothetical protein